MNYNHNVAVILTMTVHVTKHTAFQVDANARVNAYLKSIRSWLKYTNFIIVVVENSGYKFEELNEVLNSYKDRLEIISFTESQENYSEFQMHLQSKGGLEINSIHHAYNVSKFLKNSSFIIKITGRFFVPGFENFINAIDLKKFDCLKQTFEHRCEIVGANQTHFDMIFNKNLFTANGRYNYHVEDVYAYRFKSCNNVLVCPIFNIEPTQRGGLNEIYYKL